MPTTYRKRSRKGLQSSHKGLKSSRKGVKSSRKGRKSSRKGTKKVRKSNQKGGKYNEKQKKILQKKFSEFGFDNNEINTLLTKMDHTSQLFALNFDAISQQLDKYHRHYASGSEEQKVAVREWVDELSHLDDMVDSDNEKEDTDTDI